MVLAIGGVGVTGVIRLREQSRRSANKFIRRLEKALEDADTRAAAVRKEYDTQEQRLREEYNAQEQRLLKRVRDLDATVHVHHDMIRVARLDLSSLLWRDDLNECRQELEKIRDRLDTRLK